MAVSCNPSASLPLIHTEDDGLAPAFLDGVEWTFHNINFTSLWSGYITFVALPQDSSSDVVIGLQNGIVDAGSPWPFSTPESQIAADLLGGSEAQQTDLVNFFLNNLPDFVQMGGQVGTFWEFSNAVDVGSLSTAAAPEPSTLALITVAVLALGAVRRFAPAPCGAGLRPAQLLFHRSSNYLPRTKN